MKPATENTHESVLLKRAQLARALNACPRSIDNWQRRKIIPVIKITPRCVRFHLPSVLAALRRFEVREAGRCKAVVTPVIFQ